jgi:hypothetical protein
MLALMLTPPVAVSSVAVPSPVAPEVGAVPLALTVTLTVPGAVGAVAESSPRESPPDPPHASRGRHAIKPTIRVDITPIYRGSPGPGARKCRLILYGCMRNIEMQGRHAWRARIRRSRRDSK